MLGCMDLNWKIKIYQKLLIDFKVGFLRRLMNIGKFWKID